MRKRHISGLLTILLLPSLAWGGFLDDFRGKVIPSLKKQGTLDENVIAKGLKEALALGTERAVAQVGKADGYFGNELIKILLPGRMQQAADLLGGLGYQKEVDELELAMNRAAEKAAPKAGKFFGDAIRQMTLEDAKGLLNGGDTAATRFFEKKTREQLFEAFKPSIMQSMDQVGAVHAYQSLIGRYETAAPLAALVGIPSLDMNSYVTNKALDGLFLVVGQEEKKIRKDPLARTTDLLRKVFGGK